MPGRLQDRIALITGASSGIGRATAILYASEGAKLVCADLNEGTWREVAPSDESNGPTHERIQQNGGEAIFVKTDVSDPNSVEVAVAAAVEKFGRLDIMINNAGFAMESRTPGPIWELSTDLFHKTASVNINGVFYGVKYAAAQMVKQEPLSNGSRGCILNAASVLGLVGSEGAAAYCTSKGAVANMTRAAALDCAPQKIRVCAVNPGYIETHMTDKVLENDEARQFVDSMHPLGGVGKPMDIARAYLFLASDEASWITGVNMPVDGGYTAR